ncbi:hypothetical protein ACVWZM_004759 [Bradyrhizobium sp. USDA 4501]
MLGAKRVFAVRACETNRGILRREDFWFIVAARSEDETEIRTGQSVGRPSAKGHSAPDPPAVFAEEKIRIVLEGLRSEENISELCRREGIAASMYYGWSKEFLEAGKRRLVGGTSCDLRRGGRRRSDAGEPSAQKSINGDGEDEA